jgi:hypothetical protein
MVANTTDDFDSVRLVKSRNKLHALVREILAGRGLEIRELEKRLVISNPRNPEMGRIYINYLTGEMSWRRPVWNYCGYLKGYAAAPEADPDTEPVADAQTIIRALCGQDDPDEAS